MKTALQPAAGPWQDATPQSLPPFGERVLCFNAAHGRLFVARRMPTDINADRWLWQWGTKEFVAPGDVDQFAPITLRD